MRFISILLKRREIISKQLERFNFFTSSIVCKTSFKAIARKLMRIGRCKNSITGDSGRHYLSSDVLVGLSSHHMQKNINNRKLRIDMNREKSLTNRTT